MRTLQARLLLFFLQKKVHTYFTRMLFLQRQVQRNQGEAIKRTFYRNYKILLPRPYPFFFIQDVMLLKLVYPVRGLPHLGK